MLKKKSSDWAIALSVIFCSVVLFIALALGLSGRTLTPGGTTVRVRFADVTGVRVSSQVRFAGAPAGTVSAIRMLSPDERAKDPQNQVEVELRLQRDVPPLNRATEVSIAADTLLADKFVLIKDGPPGEPLLAAGDVLQGIAPTTFDHLTRNLDQVIEDVRRLVGSGDREEIEGLLAKADRVLGDAGELLKSLRPVVDDAGGLMADARAAAGDARSLISENRPRIESTLTRLEGAAGRVDELGRRAERMLRDNEGPIRDLIADFRISAENLRVGSTYAKFLLDELARRPNRILWGRANSNRLPTEQEILNTNGPFPLN